MEQTKKKSFALGYSYIGHSFIAYMFQTLVLVVLSNVVFPDFINKFAPGGTDPYWNLQTMSVVNTVSALLSSLLGILIGQWVDKKGAKLVQIVGFFVGGANLMLMPFVPNFAMFSICLFIAHTAMVAYVQMTSSSLLAHWFNKKKGMALGIAVVGISGGNAVFIKLYSVLSTNFGMVVGMWFFGIVLLIMGVLSIFWVKNYPYEVGLTPDNLPVTNQASVEDHSYKFREVAANPKVWLTLISYGIVNCVTIACVSQMIEYVCEKGIGESSAATIVSVGALGGIVGGFIISFADQKLGTRKTTITYAAISAVVYASLFFVPENSVVLIIVLVMIAFCLNGAPANLMPSMIITVFGPESFNSVSKFATPIACIFRSLGYYVGALLMSTIGGGRWAGLYIGLSMIMVIALILFILNTDKPSKIKTIDDSDDLFANESSYFGFNTAFQSDVVRIKDLIYANSDSGRYTGFVDRKILREDAEEVVEAGAFVPAGADETPLHFVAVMDEKAIGHIRDIVNDGSLEFARKIRERFPIRRDIIDDTKLFINSVNEAGLIVLGFTKKECPAQELPKEIRHVSRAIQNMIQKANSKEISSFWLTTPVAVRLAPEMKKAFYNEGGDMVCMVTFGYPDLSGQQPKTRMASVEYV